MPIQFAALASGSGGNSSLIDSGGPALLIDLGLTPRALGERLEGVGASWDRIGAVLLTHTHGDHVSSGGLRWLARRQIPFYCHEGHLAKLGPWPGFRALDAKGLVRTYDDRPFLTPDGSRVEALPVSHDSGPTFGFRIEAKRAGKGRTAALGYVTDTGCWTEPLADALTDVDLLAVEFNHDVTMQRQSGRPYYLVARNLGDRGHLSNDQGADLLAEVLRRSRREAVRQVVLLHLSRDCNLPKLALKAARGAVRAGDRRAVVHAAMQHVPHPHLPVQPPRRGRRAEPTGFPWEAAGEATPTDEATLGMPGPSLFGML